MANKRSPIFRVRKIELLLPNCLTQALPACGGQREGAGGHPLPGCRGGAPAYHLLCQIVSLYSPIVLSEEKNPERATLVMAMRSHFSRSM